MIQAQMALSPARNWYQVPCQSAAAASGQPSPIVPLQFHIIGV